MALNLRISAGRFRGRRIPAPPAAGRTTAFTPALVKEASFQLLLNRGAGPGEGFCFYDLCAGSGQMALEALSRGYGPVHACETDRARFGHLSRVARPYGRQLTLHSRDLRRAAPMLFQSNRTIGYADPPYSFWNGGRCEPLETLCTGLESAAQDAQDFRLVLVIQGPAAFEWEPSGDRITVAGLQKRYRRTWLTLLDLAPVPGGPAGDSQT